MAGFVQAVGVDGPVSIPANTLVSRSLTLTAGNTAVVLIRASCTDTGTFPSSSVGAITVTDTLGNTYTEVTAAEAQVQSISPNTLAIDFRIFKSIGVTGGTGTISAVFSGGWLGGFSWSAQMTTVELNAVGAVNQGKSFQSTVFAGISTTVGTGTNKFLIEIPADSADDPSSNHWLFISGVAFTSTDPTVPGIYCGWQEFQGLGKAQLYMLQPPLNGGTTPDTNLAVSTGFIFSYVKKFYAFPVAYKGVFPGPPSSGSSASSFVFVA